MGALITNPVVPLGVAALLLAALLPAFNAINQAHITDVEPPLLVDGGRPGGDQGPTIEPPPDEPPFDPDACPGRASTDIVFLQRWQRTALEDRGAQPFEVAGGAAVLFGAANLSEFVGGFTIEIVKPDGHVAAVLDVPFSVTPRGVSDTDDHDTRVETPESGSWTLRWTRQILVGDAAILFAIHYPCGKLPGGTPLG